MHDSFIDTDLCNNYTASCMHYWLNLLIKSYFTVKVCWFDALQHKSLLTSSWVGTPSAEWWMLIQINTHTYIYTYCLILRYYKTQVKDRQRCNRAHIFSPSLDHPSEMTRSAIQFSSYNVIYKSGCLWSHSSILSWFVLSAGTRSAWR